MAAKNPKRKPTAKSSSVPERKPTGRGGWRPGAGRPRGRKTASHTRRYSFDTPTVLFATLRAVPGVALRRDRNLKAVREAVAASDRDTFRIVHFNVLADRFHFVVEADDDGALKRGMQGLTIRLARRLNVVLERDGALFAERYYARPLRSPREIRDAIRNLLLAGGGKAIDKFSSGAWFDGWHASTPRDAATQKLAATPSPVAAPKTAALASSWRRAGLLALDETVGAVADPLTDYGDDLKAG